jgi:hypothetical protein
LGESGGGGRSSCPPVGFLDDPGVVWAEWLQKGVREAVPHRHVVLTTMPRLLRGLFRKRRELLRDLAQFAVKMAVITP